MIKKYSVILLCLFTISFSSSAQEDTTLNKSIKIIGKVVDKMRPNSFMNMVIVNKSNGQGVFGETSGQFTLPAKKSDSIVIQVTGYNLVKFSFRDSVYRKVYYVEFPLKEYAIQLEEVEIIPDRTMEEIQQDIEKLGKSEYIPETKSVNPMVSPVTALYNAFSKVEKDKQRARELENRLKKKEILKELFHKYVNADIIDLDTDQFDEFLEYCVFSNNFLKGASEYELITAVKERFKFYRANKRRDYWINDK